MIHLPLQTLQYVPGPPVLVGTTQAGSAGVYTNLYMHPKGVRKIQDLKKVGKEIFNFGKTAQHSPITALHILLSNFCPPLDFV